MYLCIAIIIIKNVRNFFLMKESFFFFNTFYKLCKLIVNIKTFYQLFNYYLIKLIDKRLNIVCDKEFIVIMLANNN